MMILVIGKSSTGDDHRTVLLNMRASQPTRCSVSLQAAVVYVDHC